MKYDVFISYKRDGGSAWAELLRAILEHKYHLKAFLDVKNMKGGEWSAQLDEEIRNSGNVIMILFKGIGKKIKSDNDIFIQEIEHAKKYNIPIIPFCALDCDFSNIIKNKNIPSVIKNVVSEQHSIVKYNHTNSEETYDLLRKQLNVRIELKVSSIHGSCSMSCQINEEPKGESKEINENENYIINIDRDFTGRILVSFYGKDIPRVEHYIFVGKEIEKETSQTICFYREYTCWSPNNNEKETLEINTSVDWIDIKSRETAKDRYMAPTFDPMQTIEAAFQNLKMQDL